MLTAGTLMEAIYRAQVAGCDEDDTALTLLWEGGVRTTTLRECRRELAFSLGKLPRA